MTSADHLEKKKKQGDPSVQRSGLDLKRNISIKTPCDEVYQMSHSKPCGYSTGTTSHFDMRKWRDRGTFQIIQQVPSRGAD